MPAARRCGRAARRMYRYSAWRRWANGKLVTFRYAATDGKLLEAAKSGLPRKSQGSVEFWRSKGRISAFCVQFSSGFFPDESPLIGKLRRLCSSQPKLLRWLDQAERALQRTSQVILYDQVADREISHLEGFNSSFELLDEHTLVTFNTAGLVYFSVPPRRAPIRWFVPAIAPYCVWFLIRNFRNWRQRIRKVKCPRSAGE